MKKKQKRKEKVISPLKSIRFKIITLLLFCIILALASCYFVIIPAAKEELILSYENNMMDLSDSNSKLIDKSIEAVNETMTTLSHSQDIYTYMTLGGRPFKAQEIIDTYLSDNSNFSSITIYDGSGKVILASDESIVGTDGASLSYVSKILAEGGAAQSDILLENVEVPSIICAIPLLSTSDDPIGVICVMVPAEYITGVLTETSIKGIDSSYAFLLSQEGNIIYNPDTAKIGEQTDDKEITAVVDNLKNNLSVETTVLTKNEAGSEKYMSYSVSPINNWITLIEADKAEMEEPINQIVSKAVIAILFILIILLVLGYIVSKSITKPIILLTKVIKQTANLDFRADTISEKLSRRTDETGEMGREIINMRYNVKEIIEKINLSSERIHDDATELDEISKSVTDFSSDNSATSEQLAAGMQETSVTTESIHENISAIEEKTIEINKKASNSIQTATEILNQAKGLEDTTLQASKRTESIFEEVREEVAVALEQSKAVTKIHQLTDSIKEIADQTSLLSLNASIEAARAGDVGKGFAVVASEIGKLADESSRTVSGISTIINEVTLAVNSIDGCLHKTLTLIERSVLPDYKEFLQASSRYNEDAGRIHFTMDEIQKAIEDLSLVTRDIAVSISDINNTIGEAAEGVTDIAGKTSTVVELSFKTSEKVRNSLDNAEALKEIVDKFIL